MSKGPAMIRHAMWSSASWYLELCMTQNWEFIVLPVWLEKEEEE